MHGFSINLAIDLSLYQHIRACGLDSPVTSINAELGNQVSMDYLKERIAAVLQEKFK